jgi:hypothetical protein
MSKLKQLQVANSQLLEELAGKNATCSQLNHAQEQLTKALARWAIEIRCASLLCGRPTCAVQWWSSGYSLAIHLATT